MTSRPPVQRHNQEPAIGIEPMTACSHKGGIWPLLYIVATDVGRPESVRKGTEMAAQNATECYGATCHSRAFVAGVA